MNSKSLTGKALWKEIKKMQLNTRVASLLCFADHPMTIQELQKLSGLDERQVRDEIRALRRVGLLKVGAAEIAPLSSLPRHAGGCGEGVTIGFYLEAAA